MLTRCGWLRAELSRPMARPGQHYLRCHRVSRRGIAALRTLVPLWGWSWRRPGPFPRSGGDPSPSAVGKGRRSGTSIISWLTAVHRILSDASPASSSALHCLHRNSASRPQQSFTHSAAPPWDRLWRRGGRGGSTSDPRIPRARPIPGHRDSLADYEPENIAWGCAQRDANADFMSPLRNKVGNDAIDAHDRKHGR
jgi:hypothetical protein